MARLTGCHRPDKGRAETQVFSSPPTWLLTISSDPRGRILFIETRTQAAAAPSPLPDPVEARHCQHRNYRTVRSMSQCIAVPDASAGSGLHWPWTEGVAELSTSQAQKLEHRAAGPGNLDRAGREIPVLICSCNRDRTVWWSRMPPSRLTPRARQHAIFVSASGGSLIKLNCGPTRRSLDGRRRQG